MGDQKDKGKDNSKDKLEKGGYVPPSELKKHEKITEGYVPPQQPKKPTKKEKGFVPPKPPKKEPPKAHT